MEHNGTQSLIVIICSFNMFVKWPKLLFFAMLYSLAFCKYSYSDKCYRFEVSRHICKLSLYLFDTKITFIINTISTRKVYP